MKAGAVEEQLAVTSRQLKLGADRARDGSEFRMLDEAEAVGRGGGDSAAEEQAVEERSICQAGKEECLGTDL